MLWNSFSSSWKESSRFVFALATIFKEILWHQIDNFMSALLRLQTYASVKSPRLLFFDDCYVKNSTNGAIVVHCALIYEM